MSNCAPAYTHSVSVRAMNPSGVVEVTTCGYSDSGGVYSVQGAIVYAGPGTANSLQVGFSAPVQVKYGVQKLTYGY